MNLWKVGRGAIQTTWSKTSECHLATRIIWAEVLSTSKPDSGCFAGALNSIRNGSRKPRKKRAEVGYHIFITWHATTVRMGFYLFLWNTWLGYENPYLLKRLLDIMVILLMEGLVWKDGNGLKVFTQAGFHRCIMTTWLNPRNADAFSHIKSILNIDVFAQTRGQQPDTQEAA
jgi:hypothetical protein